jgi:hypothetical protein
MTLGPSAQSAGKNPRVIFPEKTEVFQALWVIKYFIAIVRMQVENI